MDFDVLTAIRERCNKGALGSYFNNVWNRMEYEWCHGGGFLQWRGDLLIKKQAGEGRETEYSAILRLVENAKLDWQFSAKLLNEATDPDLIDYAVYLIKSNEARYRYLLKLARQEHSGSADGTRKSMTFS